MNYETIQKECKFGIPAADQILFNRYYTIGYSFFLRQAKWALEIVNPEKIYEFEDRHVEREDNFRPDFRVPVIFRSELIDFKGSGYDRGHLVPSANHLGIPLQNSETFLLTNMSPQTGDLNRYKWRELEEHVRELDQKPTTYETFVVTGPIIDLSKETKFIGVDPEKARNLKDDYYNVDVTIPVPHAYFKSIMIENNRGKYYMWNFILPNERADKPLEDYRVTTRTVELLAGIELWSRLKGDWINDEKTRIRGMW